MRTLNFSILFVHLNFNKFPSSDFRVHWNARNSEKRTRKWRLPSSLERGISSATKVICWVWMEMLMQLWRPESELDGIINLGSWYDCLPI